jgi:hypothetical protein
MSLWWLKGRALRSLQLSCGIGDGLAREKLLVGRENDTTTLTRTTEKAITTESR